VVALDVPFVPKDDYPDFLADHAHALTSVHFSLHDQNMADARQLMSQTNMDLIVSGLEKISAVARFVLMNARLHAPEKYFDASGLARTANRLETLLDRANLNGIIFADPYFLQAFSDAHPHIAARLEAVPSVNALLDSSGRIFSMLDTIKNTAFKSPTKLVLDRSLNRDMKRLKEVSARLRKVYPETKLHLMANEGCLFQCPYKPAHDAHIAMVNEGLCGERTFAINRDFGCIRRFLTDPGSMLASPFIRPEDVAQYESHVDGIKLCGRNKGTDFLKRTILAYLNREYQGNLLDLMDAMGDLADQVNIPNQKLPIDFAKRVSSCTKECRACTWCSTKMEQIAVQTDPGLVHI